MTSLFSPFTTRDLLFAHSRLSKLPSFRSAVAQHDDQSTVMQIVRAAVVALDRAEPWRRIGYEPTLNEICRVIDAERVRRMKS